MSERSLTSPFTPRGPVTRSNRPERTARADRQSGRVPIALDREDAARGAVADGRTSMRRRGVRRAGRRRRGRAPAAPARTRTCAGSRSSSVAMASSAARAVSSPSATPRYAASSVPARTTRPSPPPCRTRMTLGSSAPGRAVPLLRDVGRARPRDVEDVVVGVLGEPRPRRAARRRRPGPSGAATGPCASSSERHVGRSVAGRCSVTTPNPIDSTSREAKSRSHAAYML